MPILPPLSSQPYDTCNYVLNMVRTRVNDEVPTLQPQSGKLLDKTQASTLQTFNNGWRKCQSALADKGYSRLNNEVIIFSLPPVTSLDPASQTWLSWNGYFDGSNFIPGPPNLPSGFDHPLKLWERWSNQNAEFYDPPMEKILDGLPAWTKTTRIGCWEWRNDAIYMPGSQMTEDLRIRYVAFLPDFLDQGNTPWFEQVVPIVRIPDALSWFIIAELASSRADVDPMVEEKCTLKGEAALMRVFNLDVKADQRVNIRRQPRSGRGSFRNSTRYGY